MASTANIAIIPMQDILGLGRKSRMNIPGKPSGNWRWRLEEGMLGIRAAGLMNRLAAVTGRLAE